MKYKSPHKAITWVITVLAWNRKCIILMLKFVTGIASEHQPLSVSRWIPDPPLYLCLLLFEVFVTWEGITVVGILLLNNLNNCKIFPSYCYLEDKTWVEHMLQLKIIFIVFWKNSQASPPFFLLRFWGAKSPLPAWKCWCLWPVYQYIRCVTSESGSSDSFISFCNKGWFLSVNLPRGEM